MGVSHICYVTVGGGPEVIVTDSYKGGNGVSKTSSYVTVERFLDVFRAYQYDEAFL